MVAELNGACSARLEITQRSRNESDARTPPKALRAKCKQTFVRFRDTFRSAHASSRCFWLFNVLIYKSALWLRESYEAGEMKYRVIHGHVGFNFIDYDPLLVRRSLAAELD